MSDSRTPARKALSFVILVVTVLGLYNVIADNAEVVVLAKRTGCGSTDCSQTREARWPWGQSFTFEGKRGSVDVNCRRSLILLGPYDCTRP
jgi:hypothetical protein